jgi:adenylosuccinate synthase
MAIKYDKETTDKIAADYKAGVSVKDIAAALDVSERSVIAKLSSLGIYKKKQYVNKRGELPVKKEEYIERIAALLDVNLDMIDSLEKVNKSVLVLLEKALLDPKS